MPQKIRIKLKSYDHATLDQSASEIVRTARRTGALTSGPVPLPTKKTVYTVLRSPHVDKKSREQFEIRIHKRLIDITRSTAQTMEALEKLDIPAGVDIEIKTRDADRCPSAALPPSRRPRRISRYVCGRRSVRRLAAGHRSAS